MRRAAALLAIAGGVLALDQWTKRLATLHLEGRSSIEVFGDYVRLTYALNSGVAFSLGAGSRFPFYLFSIAAALVILWLFARGKVPRLGQQIALALILGGALGNLVDRITTGLVVDFIEVGIGRYRWPVFNVADSAVSVGVVLFILLGSGHETPATQPTGGTPSDCGDLAEVARLEAGAGPPATSSSEDLDHVTKPRTLGDAGRSGTAARPLPRDGASGPVS
ncbi:MAG: signal peptidase II [Candidatus Eisenbacteria bacterium]